MPRLENTCWSYLWMFRCCTCLTICPPPCISACYETRGCPYQWADRFFLQQSKLHSLKLKKDVGILSAFAISKICITIWRKMWTVFSTAWRLFACCVIIFVWNPSLHGLLFCGKFIIQYLGWNFFFWAHIIISHIFWVFTYKREIVYTLRHVLKSMPG